MGKYKNKTGKSRLGKFLSEKAPNILDIVGDVLPDNGYLGVVKNLISKDDSLTASEKAEASKLIDMELKYLELEQQDRDSAREREIEISKSDAPKLSKIIVPLLALVWVGFSAIIYILTLSNVLVAETHIQEGVITDVTHISILIVGYYFGSSKGSKDKQKHIHNKK